MLVNLHNHSQYSKLDGLITVEQMVDRAIDLGHPAVAITDHGEMAGCIPLLLYTREKDIKPIVGCEFYLVEDRKKKPKKEKRYHLTLLAQNLEGYKNLIKMCSESYISGFHYRPRIDWELLRDYNNGVLAMSACIGGMLPQAILGEAPINFDIALQKHLEIFEDRFWLELIPFNTDDQKKVNAEYVRISKEYKIPCVVTSDTHYLFPEDYYYHDLLLAIQTQKRLDDPKRFKFETDDFFFRDKKDFEKGLSYLSKTVIKNAIAETMKIADMCDDLRDSVGKISMVEFEPPVELGFNEWVTMNIEKIKKTSPPLQEQYFRYLIERGFREKIKTRQEEYVARLNHEFSVIKERDFISYFLLVRDYIVWARERDILVGPARGSAAGSLIAWLIDITEIDPIKHSLMFERFIAPGRKSLPDIDTDFEHDRRDEVTSYLMDKYGKDNVSQIATYTRMDKRQTIRDVARCLGKTNQTADKVVEGIMDNLPEDVTFQEAFDYKEFKEKAIKKISPHFKDDLDFFISAICKLEGTIRQYGRHAAGVVVSGSPLTDVVPLRVVNGNVTTQNDMRDLEELGLLKIDLLGVKSLTTISRTSDLIEGIDEMIPGHDMRPGSWEEAVVDMDVWESIGRGDCVGLFQLETPGLTQLVKKLKPKNIDELAICVALFRPGPLRSGLTDSYVRRVLSQEPIIFPFKEIEEILSETHGCMIFQEQVLKIVQELAGYSPEEADNLRKIIGKKLVEKMVEEEKRFKEKMEDRDPEKVDLLWREIVEHGEYSFNLCISGDTVVEKSAAGKHEGKEITIAEMYRRMHEEKGPVGKKYRRCGYPDILSLYPDGRLRPQKIKDIYKNGKKHVFEMTTTGGNKVRATQEHRFLTKEGWKRVADISELDEVVVEDKNNYSWIKKKKGRQTNRAKGKSYGGEGFPCGDLNPSYVDGRTIKLEEIKKEKESILMCEECGEGLGSRPEFHHKDGDSLNHTMENIIKVCNSCHKKLDYELGKRKKRWTNGRGHKFKKVLSIRYAGFEETYDIEMETFHNYLANGLISHNSHAVSYAVLAFRTAWFKHYYPAEYMTSIMNVETQNQEWYLEECRRLGLDVFGPDINMSDKDFSLSEDMDGIQMGLLSIKGVGEIAADEIIRNRPYANARDFLQKISSKVHKGIIEALIGAGAFDNIFQSNNRYEMLERYYASRGIDAVIPDLFKDNVALEVELLGTPLVSPKDIYRDLILRNTTVNDAQTWEQLPNDFEVTLGGTIHGISSFSSSNGTRFNFYLSSMWGEFIPMSIYKDVSDLRGWAVWVKVKKSGNYINAVEMGVVSG